MSIHLPIKYYEESKGFPYHCEAVNDKSLSMDDNYFALVFEYK